MPVFIDLHETKMAETEAAFDRYLSALAVGPGGFGFDLGNGVATENLAGAITACIRRGIRREHDIVAAVSRFSGSSHGDVLHLLNRLTDASIGLLRRGERGAYYLQSQFDEAFID